MRCQGRGSVLTEKGAVEMDAMIMDGDALNSGAVGCVGTVKNPIKLARYVYLTVLISWKGCIQERTLLRILQ